MLLFLFCGVLSYLWLLELGCFLLLVFVDSLVLVQGDGIWGCAAGRGLCAVHHERVRGTNGFYTS